jgi:hypothetical protein
MNTTTSPTAQQVARAPRRTRRWMIAVVGAILFLSVAGLGSMLYRMYDIPADLDLATTRPSDQGVYRVSYAPNRAPLAINQMHSWTIHVATPDGQPVTDAAITVDGGMPQHGHGLPTQPQVTKHLGNGDYLVEGLKFQMGGWWVVDFTIDAAGQHDTVRFNMILK